MTEWPRRPGWRADLRFRLGSFFFLRVDQVSIPDRFQTVGNRSDVSTYAGYLNSSCFQFASLSRKAKCKLQCHGIVRLDISSLKMYASIREQ
jgi:hypothetical protein